MKHYFNKPFLATTCLQVSLVVASGQVVLAMATGGGPAISATSQFR